MAKVEATVVINRPLAEVFQFMEVNGNALQWQSGLLETRITNDVVSGTGRAWIDTTQVLGRRMETPFQITDWQLNQKVGFQSTGGPIPMQGSFSYAPNGAGVQVTFLLTGEPGGFFKLAEPVLVRLIQRQWDTNLANLKDVLEAQA